MTIDLVVSTGSPAGVGPEVSLVAATKVPRGVRLLLLGDIDVLRERAVAVGLDARAIASVRSAEEAFGRTREPGRVAVLSPHGKLRKSSRRPGFPSPEGGAAALGFIDEGLDLVVAGRAAALVTGPVSKAEIVSSGVPGSALFLGHTEHLMRRLGRPSVTMAFWSRTFTTSLVTTHLALSDVPAAITKPAVVRAIVDTAEFLASVRPRGARPVRLVVSGVNPHAGEDGLLGTEELRVVGPAIATARARLARAGVPVDVSGPVPAESALRLASEGHYDGVVAMFHDQATIAMKLTGFGEAVNVSLGLPVVRTSVDHGTAFDRAGRGTADARGMLEAVRLAARMVRGRTPR
ncbi:MAG: 4-hydroxythreonine-4-phosphate dehydrogenase PdxA [Myxococcales bacterium]|nr:4-hydroxythreonine-4-phosphate dehydrogenase PdxA [Myxococcales bacterium]